MKKNTNFTNMQQLLENSKVQTWRTIMAAYNQIYRFLETELLKEDCSISRFQIFFYLYFYQGMSAIELARQLNVTRGNISTFLARLESDGYVKMKPTGERGGKHIVQLTRKGKQFFEKIFPQHIARVKLVTPVISKDSLKKLSNIKKIT